VRQDSVRRECEKFHGSDGSDTRKDHAEGCLVSLGPPEVKKVYKYVRVKRGTSGTLLYPS
jgi:hypothetical protein